MKRVLVVFFCSYSFCIFAQSKDDDFLIGQWESYSKITVSHDGERCYLDSSFRVTFFQQNDYDVNLLDVKNITCLSKLFNIPLWLISSNAILELARPWLPNSIGGLGELPYYRLSSSFNDSYFLILFDNTGDEKIFNLSIVNDDTVVLNSREYLKDDSITLYRKN